MSHTDITSYIFIIPLIILLVRFNKLSSTQKWIALLIAVSGLSSLTAYELAERGSYNTFVLHVFVILELSLYTWIFHNSMPDRLTSQWAFAVIAGFVVLSLINTIFFQPIPEFNTYARALEAVILILLSLTYFYHLFREMKVYDLHKLPAFWVASGVLIDFSVNLLFFSFMGWLVHQHLEVYQVAEFIHSIANIILYLLLAVGLWVNPAKARTS